MASFNAKKVEPKEETGHVWVAVYGGPVPGRRAHLGTLVCKDHDEAEALIMRLQDDHTEIPLNVEAGLKAVLRSES